VVVSALQITGVGRLGLGLRGLGGLLASGLGGGRSFRSGVDGLGLLGRLRLGSLGDLARNLVRGSSRLLLLRGLGLRLGSFVNGLGFLGRLGLGSLRSLGGGRNLGGGGNTGLRVGADVDEVGLSDGDNLLGSSVGTRDVAGRDRVDDDGLLLAGLGDRSNGVGTSRWADVGGGLDDAGNDTVVLGLLGVRAGDCGSSLNNGGDTAHGMSSSGNLGGLTNANGGRLGHSHGGSGEGVSAGSRALVLLGGRDGNNDLGGGRSNGLRSLGGRSLISGGRLGLSSLLGSDGLLGGLGRRRRVGDNWISQYIYVTV